MSSDEGATVPAAAPAGVKPKEEEQDGMSIHSPYKPPPTFNSLTKEDIHEVELKLKLIEALAIYPPHQLQGVHGHFVLYGIMEYLNKSFNVHFSANEILQLIDRFYNIKMLKSDDDEIDLLNHEEDFILPPSFFAKDHKATILQ